MSTLVYNIFAANKRLNSKQYFFVKKCFSYSKFQCNGIIHDKNRHSTTSLIHRALFHL